MLTTETKRHIDSARQVLVGKVPDPKSQIEQITNALIYKFMDDMDEQAAALGGKRKYFTGDYEKYSWRKLMLESLGAHERLILYRDAIERMANNPNLPKLFQSIFRNVYLPYNDARTLTMFLQEIDYFDYKHSEELGNAYEYLLSIMGSQGDAGQFRTPRHIIDFIVQAVNPGKNDSVLDPACGTAGFLISAYKHVMAKHDGKDKETGEINPNEPRLTRDEIEKIYRNYHGFDIDDNMVKMAKVNMYLHNFPDPNIVVHDSLSSEDYWNEKYDVILANPPFMTPKGGIVPHKKFGVESNRAEVLFVDYIKNHLKPNGRAGIIVPEGIIFQSGSAYKQLRKSLVEDGLYAVISLPSGVFAPYSGVKTSVLMFNNSLSRTNKEILFVKIEADGFELGAQRRASLKNDLPAALKILNSWNNGEKLENTIATYVEKSIIAKSGDYNLSGDRYRVVNDYSNAKWPIVELDTVCVIKKGSSITKNSVTEGEIPVIAGGQQPAYYHNISNRSGKTITVSASGAYAGFVNYFTQPIFASDCSTIKSSNEMLLKTEFVYRILKGIQEDIYKLQTGGGQPHIYPKDLAKIRIPLPPLEVQEQLVSELRKYESIINSAKQIAQSWKPKINVSSEWDSVKISEICKIERGASPRPIENFVTNDQNGLNWIKIGDTKNADKYITQTNEKITKEGANKSRKVYIGDFILSNSMSFGRPYIMKIEGYIHDGWLRLTENPEKIIKDYLYYILGSDLVKEQFELAATGGVVRNLNSELVRNVTIPLPKISTQVQIVEKIESERKLVESTVKLKKIYEQKTKDVISKLWEE